MKMFSDSVGIQAPKSLSPRVTHRPARAGKSCLRARSGHPRRQSTTSTCGIDHLPDGNLAIAGTIPKSSTRNARQTREALADDEPVRRRGHPECPHLGDSVVPSSSDQPNPRNRRLLSRLISVPAMGFVIDQMDVTQLAELRMFGWTAGMAYLHCAGWTSPEKPA